MSIFFRLFQHVSFNSFIYFFIALIRANMSPRTNLFFLVWCSKAIREQATIALSQLFSNLSSSVSGWTAFPSFRLLPSSFFSALNARPEDVLMHVDDVCMYVHSSTCDYTLLRIYVWITREAYVLARDVARGNRCIYSYREFLDSCCFQIAFRQRQTFLRERKKDSETPPLPPPLGDEQKPTREGREKFILHERRRRTYTCLYAISYPFLSHCKITVTAISIKSELKQRVGCFPCFYF